jgi:hypothetical protein
MATLNDGSSGVAANAATVFSSEACASPTLKSLFFIEEKKALDPKCELVHILARWTWPVIFRKHTNVRAFVLDSNRFFTHRKGAL